MTNFHKLKFTKINIKYVNKMTHEESHTHNNIKCVGWDVFENIHSQEYLLTKRIKIIEILYLAKMHNKILYMRKNISQKRKS